MSSPILRRKLQIAVELLKYVSKWESSTYTLSSTIVLDKINKRDDSAKKITVNTSKARHDQKHENQHACKRRIRLPLREIHPTAINTVTISFKSNQEKRNPHSPRKCLHMYQHIRRSNDKSTPDGFLLAQNRSCSSRSQKIRKKSMKGKKSDVLGFKPTGKVALQSDKPYHFSIDKHLKSLEQTTLSSEARLNKILERLNI